MSKNEFIIQSLEERKENISLWNAYSDGFKDGLEYAIGLLRVAENNEPVEEMEVIHA
ncbi:hypothetical protein D3C87_755800 [compost metagenome]